MVSLIGAENPIALEDTMLVSQIAGGDLGEPMEELYRRYAGKLYWVGLQLLGNAGLADELVQECFLRLWRTAGRFDVPRGTVSAYMFVIARSIATDLRRRPSFSQPDGADQILESLAVGDALDSLPPAHREVLMLCRAEELTQSQIAQRLGLPLGTVRTRMHHGLRVLKAALAERGFNG